ncbi:MAG: hypothetical protein DWQ35_18455 [Planctomycetota bacterium]|nr:MAG: hypothetical protein DWQ35_18455 [Planctomycetota bacterium]REK22894.1 MAG: hypothetical protein DWQ42_16420 [Planctomycetota bacterium]REK37406.1 MAG: hypothetical protein DWQ46_22255 [Planctomycetota bacterium]
MLEARQGKEIQVTIKNEIGALGKLTKMLAEQGVNVLAVNSRVEEGEAHFKLITEDMLRTMDLLHEHGYEPRQLNVVIVECEHRPGILKHLTDRLVFHEVNIYYLYVTATLDQEECLVVLSTSNNQRAIIELNW